MTSGALTLVEYSTPVEYSRSSKLDFYSQKSSFRILLTCFQNDSQCVEKKNKEDDAWILIENYLLTHLK